MAGTEINIHGADGSFMGYLCKPSGGTGPGVVVLQEIFGIDAWMRNLCEWLAGEGYMALAPDLFWRLQPGIRLDPTVPEEFSKGLAYYQEFNSEKGVEDIQASINALRRLPGCSGKVGNIGFCLGGALSYMTAAKTDTDASASYYGVGIENMLDMADRIRKPIILHFAGKDGFVPKAAQDKIKAALNTIPHATMFDYPGRDHAFCRETDPRHYHAADAKLAHRRTFDLFKTALQ